MDFKPKLNDIFDQNVEGIKMKSKCMWYEEGEKHFELLLNLEKNCALQSKVHLLEIKGKQIEDKKKIIENFYENLFSNGVTVSSKSILIYLKDVSLPKLSMEQRELSEGEFTEKVVKDAL